MTWRKNLVENRFFFLFLLTEEIFLKKWIAERYEGEHKEDINDRGGKDGKDRKTKIATVEKRRN